MIELRELGLGHPDRLEYQPSSWAYLRRALGSEPIGPEHVFLDYGCGKGRVIHQAAQMPFGRVIGLDIAAPLLEVARRNIDSGRTHLRCSKVELVCADVRDFEVPDDVTHAYLYNPFVGETFEACLDGLVRSLDRRPRRLLLMLINSPMARSVVGTGRFDLLRTEAIRRQGRKVAMHIYVGRRAHSV